ncbi:MAG TPA: VOC family protein [Candidatus Eisenbacteria bacterium]|nr:VOC family protein [Candidatus Eisenbacteria bacterium]
MLANRSVPKCTVIPILNYPDVSAAADWLCKAFGFTVRLRIGNHRIQLKAGDGCLILGEGTATPNGSASVMVRVVDAHSHHAHALQNGANILAVPKDHPYGERQYNALDFAGHRWTFTQSIADAAPEDWGGTSVDLD